MATRKPKAKARRKVAKKQAAAIMDKIEFEWNDVGSVSFDELVDQRIQLLHARRRAYLCIVAMVENESNRDDISWARFAAEQMNVRINELLVLKIAHQDVLSAGQWAPGGIVKTQGTASVSLAE